MSVLATVAIAIAVAVIAFIIGVCVGISGSEPVCPFSTESNPIKTSNTEPPVPAVTSKVVLPKRISKAEYNKRVNACLKDAVTRAVSVYVPMSDKEQKQRIIKSMYNEWHDKLCDILAYGKYNPEFQRLDIVGRKTSPSKSDYSPYSLRFDADWSLKQPYDSISYARRHK